MNAGTDAAALPRASGARPKAVVLIGGELLGDAIVHLPAYRALRHGLPGHEIVVVCEYNTVYGNIFASIRPTLFDRLIEGVPMHSLAAAVRAIDALGSIDLIVEFRANFIALWTFLAGRRARRSIANTSGYFLRRGVRGVIDMRPRSKAARFHRLIEIALGRPLPFDARLPGTAAGRAAAERLLPPGRRYLGIAPGSTARGKFWPVEGHRAFAASFAGMGLTPVYLLGPGEEGYRDWIAGAAPGAIILDRSCTGDDTAALPWLFHAAAARMALVVAAEGGIGHLVATQSVPLVTLAGPSNAVEWRPVTPLWWLVRAQDFGSNEMKAIPAAAVTEAVGRALAFIDARAAERG